MKGIVGLNYSGELITPCPYKHKDKPFPEVLPFEAFGHEFIQKICARLIKQGFTISLYNKTILIHGVNNG